MANEAVLVVRQEDPIDFIVSDSEAIEKGAILQLTSPRTATATTAQGQKIAGIAAREKVANDGRTRLAIYTKGVFRGTSGAAISVGAPLMISSTTNKIITATGVSGASILGYALQATTATDQEFEFILNIGVGGDIA